VAGRLREGEGRPRQGRLLDPARKRPLPPYPLRIAVVTSPDGAALQDIIARDGAALAGGTTAGAADRVQGEGAERDICAALALLCRIEGLDLAIIAGAAARVRIFGPSITSAWLERWPRSRAGDLGGRPRDRCDTLRLVADVRAPTPSAAAEAATPDRADVLAELAHLGARLARGLPGAPREWPSAWAAPSIG